MRDRGVSWPPMFAGVWMQAGKSAVAHEMRSYRNAIAA